MSVPFLVLDDEVKGAEGCGEFTNVSFYHRILWSARPSASLESSTKDLNWSPLIFYRFIYHSLLPNTRRLGVPRTSVAFCVASQTDTRASGSLVVNE